MTRELEAALGLPGSFRREIEDAGLFVRPVGDAYALHPLVREFLRARRDREETIRVALADVHLRLAGALASSGRTPEAIDHWLAGEDYESAAGRDHCQRHPAGRYRARDGRELARTAPG